MKLNNVNETLEVIYKQFDKYEFVQIEGTGYSINKPIILIISIWFINSKIRIDTDNKSHTTIQSITLNEIEDVEDNLNRILKDYQLEICSVAFSKSIKNYEIMQYSFIDNKLAYALLSTRTGESEMTLSYIVENPKINYSDLIKNYNYFNRILAKNTDFKIIRDCPHPISNQRMRKLDEIGIY